MAVAHNLCQNKMTEEEVVHRCPPARSQTTRGRKHARVWCLWQADTGRHSLNPGCVWASCEMDITILIRLSPATVLCFGHPHGLPPPGSVF